MIPFDPETVIRAGPTLLNRLLKRFEVNLLQDTFKIVVKFLRKPGREYLLDALIKNFLDLEPFAFEDVQKVHQFVFSLHVATKQLLILLDLLLQLLNSVHFGLR